MPSGAPLKLDRQGLIFPGEKCSPLPSPRPEKKVCPLEPRQDPHREGDGAQDERGGMGMSHFPSGNPQIPPSPEPPGYRSSDKTTPTRPTQLNPSLRAGMGIPDSTRWGGGGLCWPRNTQTRARGQRYHHHQDGLGFGDTASGLGLLSIQSPRTYTCSLSLPPPHPQATACSVLCPHYAF